MRLRLPSIAFLALIVPVAGMAAISACGDTADTGDAGPDATADVAKDVAPDVVVVEASTDAGCANDVDLTQFLPSADAAIDVDAGGINISQCTGCLKTSCGTNINTCNQDCACRQSIVDAITCITQGGSFQTCGLDAITSGDQNVQALFGCALNSCGAICIPSDGGIPKDAAPTDAADGG